MHHWYYADAARAQHGPLDAAALQQLHHDGAIDRDTLVWRPGLPQWQPLGQQADALGIVLAAPAATVAASPGLAADGSAATAAEALTAAVPIDPGSSDVVYAGLWRRVAASIIDSFVTTMLSYALIIPLMLVCGLGLGLLAGHTDGKPGPAVIGFIVLLYAVLLVLPAVYFGWMQGSRHQASLGKLAVGIKVTRGDGSRSGFWRGFWRYIAYMLVCVATCGIGMVVTAFMAGLSRRKQAPHDFFCDTLVVDRWAFSDQPQRQQRGLDTVSLVVLIAYGALTLLSLLVVAIAIAAGMAAR